MTGALSAAVALGACWVAGWIVRWRWSGRVLAYAGRRSSHTVPTTRLGGIAIAAGLAAGLAAGGAPGRLLAGTATAAAIAGAAGLAEDLRGVPAAGRLAAQAVAAVAAVSLIGAGWLGVLAALWVVAFVNAYNFMDGIDGLAAAQLVVAGAAWLVAGAVAGSGPVRVLAGVALGCGAGFLPHNRSPARMFMGDLGAYAAGAWLAAGAVAGIGAGVPPVAMLAPLALFAFDTSWTLVGRLWRGENVFEAHRTHLYQRLVVAGWSHARTTGFAAVVMTATAAAGLLALAGGAAAHAAAFALGAAALAGYRFVAARAAA